MSLSPKTPAFGIRVGANRKTWLVVKGEGRTKVRLGHYPAMTLQEARKRALVALGTPLQQRIAISFPAALDAFLKLPRWRSRSRVVLQSSLRHFTWKRNLDKITHEDILAALEAIKAPSARAHAFKDIRTFFNWCVPRYLAASPCVGIKMPAQPSRDRILTKEELKRVWNACEGKYGTIIKLLILTGQRKGEIAQMKREWIGDKTITVPASVAKNKREHTFPIGKNTSTILDTYEMGGIPFNDWQRQKRRLDKASGVTDWVVHDLRRSFASLHAEIGTPIHIIEKLLNHVSGSLSGVAGIYNRYNYQNEMRQAVQTYESHLTSLLSTETVVP